MCQPRDGFKELNWMFRGHATIKLWNTSGDILFPELDDSAVSIGHYTKNKSIYYIE